MARQPSYNENDIATLVEKWRELNALESGARKAKYGREEASPKMLERYLGDFGIKLANGEGWAYPQILAVLRAKGFVGEAKERDAAPRKAAPKKLEKAGTEERELPLFLRAFVDRAESKPKDEKTKEDIERAEIASEINNTRSAILIEMEHAKAVIIGAERAIERLAEIERLNVPNGRSPEIVRQLLQNPTSSITAAEMRERAEEDLEAVAAHAMAQEEASKEVARLVAPYQERVKEAEKEVARLVEPHVIPEFDAKKQEKKHGKR